jgi:hypothetical protein
MRMMRSLLFFAVIAASVTSAFGSTITTSAYEFSSISVSSENRAYVLGFWFQTQAPVVITKLGYFDDSGNGFGVSHEVGLFGSSGALLTSTTLAAGTTDPLDGHFRYAAIQPIELPAGTSYLIAATSDGSTDPWGYGHPNDIAGLTISPLISVPSNAAVFVDGNTLAFPTDRWGYQFYAGPNMQLTAAANVPEPGSLGLVLVGAIAIGFGGLRKLRNRP